LWIVDAFAAAPFAGNPAAVCVADAFPDPGLMQAIAAENNLSETAFVVRAGPAWEIRWFTPAVEVGLCGHATLAAAWVILERVAPGTKRVRFESAAGPLGARVSDGDVVLDFPSRPPEAAADAEAVTRALGAAPVSCWRAADNHLALLGSEAAVAAVAPDPRRVAELGGTGLIVTAAGDEVDFVSRYFAPAVGVTEDPVTGSAHCTLIPFWSRRLERDALEARQISARGGVLRCRDRGDRVDIGGPARLYLEGRISL
jgi:PhzF family phenazine biosynthesis protein